MFVVILPIHPPYAPRPLAATPKTALMSPMDDPFKSLIPDARAFFARLQDNNTRDWFADHKAEYESSLKRPATHLLDVISADLTRLTSTPPKSKLFRIHRDLRFSKDKTPYNTHLHLAWSTKIGAQTGNAPRNGWFLGISPDYVRIGGGLMMLDKTALPVWRDAVAGDTGARLSDQINALLADGFHMDPPALKRVPAPYDKSHIRGHLLRRKSITLWCDVALPMNDITGELHTQFARLWPFQQTLAGLF